MRLRIVWTIFILMAVVLGACRSGDDGTEQPRTNPTAPIFPTATSAGAASTSVAQFPTSQPLGPTATRFQGFPTVQVAPTIPTSYPENIQINSPTTGSEQKGNVVVFGSSSHPDFIQYALEYGPDPNPGNLWYPITPQAVTVPVVSNALGAWNTTLVSDGTYQIRLHVYLSGGRELTNAVVSGIRVRNQQPTPIAQAANTRPTISPIASLNMRAGTSTTIALGIFDADGDTTTFVAASDNTAVAAITPSGQAITITAIGAGIATVRVEVNDGRGGTASTSFLVNVSAPPTATNNAPRISPIPSQVIGQGATVTIPVTAVDSDGDTVTLGATSAAPSIAQVTVDGASLRVAGFAAGSTTITVTASDGRGQTTTAIFSVVVNPSTGPNSPPSLGALSSQSLEVDESRELTLSISDPDGDATTFTLQNSNPSVVLAEALDGQTIRLRALQAGQAQVTIVVRDARGSSISSLLTVIVNEPPLPNQNPVIATIPNQTATVGERLDIGLNISDPDGGTITFSPVAENTGVATTGVLNTTTLWVFGVSEGTTTITVSVGDGQGGSTSTSFAVTVEPAVIPNQPPVIPAVDSQAVEVGQSVLVTIDPIDPDGDPLTVFASSDAANIATVFQSSEKELTVTGVAEGRATMTVIVDDGRGGTVAMNFDVVVESQNRPPSIAPIAAQLCIIGDSLTIPLSYSDPDGDTVTIAPSTDDPAVAVGSLLDETTLQIQCVSAGEAHLTVEASDGDGATNATTFVVTVSSPNQNPVIDNIAPLELEPGQIVTVPVVYSDPDGDDVALAAVSDNDAVAAVLVSGPTELSVTANGDGVATITVTVTDTDGGSANTTFNVVVATPNQDPVIDPVAALDMLVGDTTTVAISYSDADGDELKVEVLAETPSVIEAVLNDPNTITLNAIGAGQSVVTISVNDGRGGTAQTEFMVTVTAPNQDPVIAPLPSISLDVGESVPVLLNINDPDVAELIVTATSSDETIATVVVVSPSELTITAIGGGETTITVHVEDGLGGSVETSFNVAVAIPNTDPTIDPILPITLTAGDSVPVAIVTGDADGDVLNVTATSDTEGVATVGVNNASELLVTAVGAGQATITVSVDDGRGGVAQAAFGVTVNAANTDPTIDPILPITLTAGDSTPVAIVTGDADGDVLTVSATSDNEGVATVGVNNASELQVTAVSAGQATITVSVDDGRGGVAQAAFGVTVNAANTDPTIDPILPITLTTGDSIPVAIVTGDADGDALTVTAASDNEGVATVGVNNASELQVTAVSAGQATITVSVDDGRGGVAQAAFGVTVNAANTDPTIDPILPITLTTGDSVPVVIVTGDADGDVLNVTATSDTEGVATVGVNNASELLVTAVGAGQATITVSVDDGRGGVAQAAFGVTVNAANTDPTIDPILPITLTAGDSTPVAIVTGDADGDVLTITATSDNEGVATVGVNNASELQVTAIGAGQATITVSVDDGRGGVAQAAFGVTVNAANTDPTIDPILPISLTTNDSVPVVIVTGDADGDVLTITAASDNEGVATVGVNNASELQVTAIGAGQATITVGVDDGRGGVAQAAFGVTVNAANTDPTIDPILPITLTAGDSTPVAIVTGDADGDVLTVTAASDNEGVATVGVNNASELQVTAIGAGQATITVSVDDGRGGVAQAAFGVTVNAANTDPTINPILPITLNTGDSVPVVIVTGDADGDVLTITAASDNEGVATVGVNNASELQVTAIGAGQATITVSVDDGRGGVAQAAFGVTVEAANQDPSIAPLPPIELTTGDSSAVLLNIIDPDVDELKVSATSDNEAVASTTVANPSELIVFANGAGTATITVSVDDGRGGTAQTAFMVTVQAPNQQPFIDPVAPQTCLAGEVPSVLVNATDPDGDFVNLSATSDNPNAVGASMAGNSLTLNCFGAGNATITVTADDGRGGTAQTAFMVTVQAPNQQPTLDPVAPQTCLAGEVPSVLVNATDPDGDFVNLSATSDNPNAVGASMAGNSLTLNCFGAGNATITVTADDGRGGTAQTAFMVTVQAPNQQPFIDPVAPQTCLAGEAPSVLVNATDPDGDFVNLSATSDNPNAVGASMAGNSLTLNCFGAGNATITVTADDGRGGTAQTAFMVTVQAPNQQPFIDPVAPQTCLAGEVPSVLVNATDPDGDFVNLSATSDNPNAVGASMAGNSLTLNCFGAGNATITVTADDGRGGTAQTAFMVTVQAPNQQPFIDPVAPQTCLAGEVPSVLVNASDPDGDFVNLSATSDNPNAVGASMAGNSLTLNCFGAGNATITVTADDGRGGTAQTAFMVTVQAPNQQPFIDPVAPQTCLAGEVPSVLVNASDPDGDFVNLSATSDNPNAVGASMAGNSLTLNCFGAGNATITVTADDGRGGTAQTAFMVTVGSSEERQPPFDINSVPEFPDFDTQALRDRYTNAINLGRNPNAFSFAGDDSLTREAFLDPIVLGQYNLGSYPNLQNAINVFTFDFQSVAYGQDWTIESLLNSQYADPGLCQPGVAPLQCELDRTAPVLLFINFTPTNTTSVGLDVYKASLNEVLDIIVKTGTIPVLVTLPDDGTVGFDTLNQYNELIVSIAEERELPLWNLALTLQPASAGVYAPSPAGTVDFSDASLTYGVNRRTWGALTVLNDFRGVFNP
ncbi:MAG: hypothetical protein H6673_13000 [Anaerolineales bacterium]|nr:hypothetical protein [Anaerolineales bacterium]